MNLEENESKDEGIQDRSSHGPDQTLTNIVRLVFYPVLGSLKKNISFI